MIWRIAWESYISTYNNILNQKVYQNLKDMYSIAINKIQSPYLSYNSLKGLSHHLLLAYIYGVDNLSQNSNLDNFYKQSNPLLREHAMWYCCTKVLEGIKTDQKMEDKETLFDRILELWKYRIEKTKKLKSEGIIKEFNGILDSSAK